MKLTSFSSSSSLEDLPPQVDGMILRYRRKLLSKLHTRSESPWSRPAEIWHMSEADLTYKTFQRQLMHFCDDRMPKTPKEGNKAGINVPEQQVPKERSKLQDCSLLKKHKQKHPTKVKQSQLWKLHKETLKVNHCDKFWSNKNKCSESGCNDNHVSLTHKVSFHHCHHGWQWLAAITPNSC